MLFSFSARPAVVLHRCAAQWSDVYLAFIDYMLNVFTLFRFLSQFCHSVVNAGVEKIIITAGNMEMAHEALKLARTDGNVGNPFRCGWPYPVSHCWRGTVLSI